MRTLFKYITEAQKSRPSGWTRNKKISRKVTNTYLAGDVYDFHSGTYQQEDEYIDSDYEGFIFDKEGNEYKVYGYSETGDAGRIVGGSTKYSVIIIGQDLKINLNGYTAIFSMGHGTSILPDIDSGYYLEDYLAKNTEALGFSDKSNEKVKNLIANGDKDAKSFSTEKREKKESKELAFAQRYVEFGSLTFEKSRKDSQLYISIGYKNRAANAGQEAQITAAIEPFVTKLLEGVFNLPISEIYGLRISIKTNIPDGGNICPAIDIKKKNLVFIKSEYKGLNKSNKKIILDTPVKLSISPIIDCWYNEASDKLKEYINIVFDKFYKKQKKTRTAWIKDAAENYYNEYENAYWGKRKYTRKEAHELAVNAWDCMINKYDPSAKRNMIYIDVETLSEYVNEIKHKYSVTANAPDTSVNNLPEIETTVKPIEPPVKTDTKLSASTKSAAYDKMTAWHNGTRKQNVGALSDAKLKLNYDVCVELGYDAECEILKAEATKRGITL